MSIPSNGFTTKWVVGLIFALAIPTVSAIVSLAVTVNDKMDRNQVEKIIDDKQQVIIYKLDEQGKKFDKVERSLEKQDQNIQKILEKVRE
jgi:hypothetical protein